MSSHLAVTLLTQTGGLALDAHLPTAPRNHPRRTPSGEDALASSGCSEAAGSWRTLCCSRGHLSQEESTEARGQPHEHVRTRESNQALMAHQMSSLEFISSSDIYWRLPGTRTFCKPVVFRVAQGPLGVPEALSGASWGHVRCHSCSSHTCTVEFSRGCMVWAPNRWESCRRCSHTCKQACSFTASHCTGAAPVTVCCSC